jgi:hypothetical protein
MVSIVQGLQEQGLVTTSGMQNRIAQSYNNFPTRNLTNMVIIGTENIKHVRLFL